MGESFYRHAHERTDTELDILKRDNVTYRGEARRYKQLHEDAVLGNVKLSKICDKLKAERTEMLKVLKGVDKAVSEEAKFQAIFTVEAVIKKVEANDD